MWPKDDYQEHMLGYLGEIQTGIDQLACSRLQRHELNLLYSDLDITSERLWQLIGARDDEWELCRFSLEASCDRLLRGFNHVPSTGSPGVSVSLIALEIQAEFWEATGVLG